MDSRAIAVLIISVGIMVLIVSSAVGAPAYETSHALSVWSAEIQVLPAMPAVVAGAARALPPMEADIHSDDDGLTCTAAHDLAEAHLPERGACKRTGRLEVLGD